MSRINHVVTLGSGVLGGQIAWHSAFRGTRVVACDPTEDALSKCRAAVAGADLVIESVPEDPEVKTSAYRTMAPLPGMQTSLNVLPDVSRVPELAALTRPMRT
jgi:3-hydroxybutyryl-CoA dehydrogenase